MKFPIMCMSALALLLFSNDAFSIEDASAKRNDDLVQSIKSIISERVKNLTSDATTACRTDSEISYLQTAKTNIFDENDEVMLQSELTILLFSNHRYFAEYKEAMAVTRGEANFDWNQPTVDTYEGEWRVSEFGVEMDGLGQGSPSSIHGHQAMRFDLDTSKLPGYLNLRQINLRSKNGLQPLSHTDMCEIRR